MACSRRFSVAALLVAVVLFPRAGRAEFFTDFYFGAAITQSTSVHVSDESFPTAGFTERTDIDPSFSLGMRFGWWVDPAPWLGFAFDFSYFEAEGGPIDDNFIYPMSFLFMFRLPLARSAQFPYGRFQPYAAVGPALFFSECEVDVEPQISDEISDSGDDFGLDVRAGFAWLFIPNIAVFFEYRFTYFRQEIDEEFFGVFDTEISSAQSLSTHHLLLGLSFRF
jgi:opacity protein-like surface antigen